MKRTKKVYFDEPQWKWLERFPSGERSQAIRLAVDVLRKTTKPAGKLTIGTVGADVWEKLKK